MRAHNAATPRKRWAWLGGAWLASLVLASVIVGLAVRSTTPAAGEHRQVRTLTLQNEALQQQVANLQRANQVADIAQQSLRNSLTEREEEISGLRADLGFYSRLVGSDAQREGPRVQEVQLRPIDGTLGWNLTVSLTQNARRGDDISGLATVTVEGLRANKVVQLPWPALGDSAQKNGMPFKFKYFQQLHATIVLPADMRPNRLRIDLAPSSGQAVTRTVAWSDAVAGSTSKTEGDSDAHP